MLCYAHVVDTSGLAGHSAYTFGRPAITFNTRSRDALGRADVVSGSDWRATWLAGAVTRGDKRLRDLQSGAVKTTSDKTWDAGRLISIDL